jgi:hypothetical protein
MTAGAPVGVNTAKPIAASAVTPADLAALEARVLDEVSHRARPMSAQTSLTPSDYDKLLEFIRELNNTVATSVATKAETARLSTRLTELSATVAQMAQNQQGGR